MRFDECFEICLQEKELVAEFDRLTGSNLSLRGSGLDLQIDEATGRLESDMSAFSAFVYDAVWSRLDRSESSPAPTS